MTIGALTMNRVSMIQTDEGTDIARQPQRAEVDQPQPSGSSESCRIG